MARRSPGQATLLEVAYGRTRSLRQAARVVAFIMAWGVVRDQLGREPTMEEYAQHWRESPATAYREQALFREVFDRCETPAPVLDLLAAGKTDKRSLGQLATA